MRHGSPGLLRGTRRAGRPRCRRDAGCVQPRRRRAQRVQVLFCCMLRLPHVEQQRRCAKAALALCRLCLQRVAVNHRPAVPELPLPQVDSRTLPQSMLGRHLGGSHCKDDAACRRGSGGCGWGAADATPPAAGDRGAAAALQGGDRGMLYLRQWLNDESPEVRVASIRRLCSTKAVVLDGRAAALTLALISFMSTICRPGTCALARCVSLCTAQLGYMSSIISHRAFSAPFRCLCGRQAGSR